MDPSRPDPTHSERYNRQLQPPKPGCALHFAAPLHLDCVAQASRRLAGGHCLVIGLPKSVRHVAESGLNLSPPRDAQAPGDIAPKAPEKWRMLP